MAMPRPNWVPRSNDPKRKCGFGQLDLVSGSLRRGIARDHRLGATGPGLMVNLYIAERPFDAIKCVVVQRHLVCLVGIGNHQLDRVAVPGAVRGVLVILVRDDKPEVDVVRVVNDLHRGGLIVGTGPSASVILFEQDQRARRRIVGPGSFGSPKAWIGQDRDAGPLRQSCHPK